MKTAKRERRGWVPYALAAGFVSLASSAVLPQGSIGIVALLSRIQTLFS